jgi:hypothetical protein
VSKDRIPAFAGSASQVFYSVSGAGS